MRAENLCATRRGTVRDPGGKGREVCSPVPSVVRKKNPVEGAFKSIEMGFELPDVGIE